MSAPVVVQGAVEGDLDAALLDRILSECGAELGTTYGRRGKGRLRHQIEGFNRAALHMPWVVLVDLDDAQSCGPSLVREWLPNPAPLMRLRVAVTEAESWLMADAERMADFLHVSVDLIPRDPDSLDDAKRQLVSLAQRSRRRDIRDGLVPSEGSGRSVGVAYNALLVGFIRNEWRPRAAADRSDSFRRCLAAVENLCEAASS